jgi:hypothetical protein
VQRIDVSIRTSSRWRRCGVTQSLDALSGYTTSQAYDINNNGWLVGTSSGQAVLWTSVPEPPSILALVGGITGLGGLALRHKK